MTLREHKKEIEELIQRYKDYLLGRGVDAKHRTIAWAINERDELDNDHLINELARLGLIVSDLRIRSLVNEAYLDEPYEWTEEILESNLNRTMVDYEIKPKKKNKQKQKKNERNATILPARIDPAHKKKVRPEPAASPKPDMELYGFAKAGFYRFLPSYAVSDRQSAQKDAGKGSQ